jgi:hypothetical protein
VPSIGSSRIHPQRRRSRTQRPLDVGVSVEAAGIIDRIEKVTLSSCWRWVSTGKKDRVRWAPTEPGKGGGGDRLREVPVQIEPGLDGAGAGEMASIAARTAAALQYVLPSQTASLQFVNGLSLNQLGQRLDGDPRRLPAIPDQAHAARGPRTTPRISSSG